MPFLQIIATKNYGFIHLNSFLEDKIRSENQYHMKHHGKSIHKLGYNGIRSLMGRKCLAPPNELTHDSFDPRFTIKWQVCF
jgi:hypothetical protein